MGEGSGESETRYDTELRNWTGFGFVEELRELFKENPGALEALDTHTPDVSRRLLHFLDLVDQLRAVPGHALPLGTLQGLESQIETVLSYVRASLNDPAGQAPNVDAQLSNALAVIIPLLPAVSDRDFIRSVDELRRNAQSALHGIRTSAGRTESRLEEVVSALKRQHEEAESQLRASWDETKAALANEAAEMRSRTEAVVTEGRTNAEAQLQAMRNEVSAVKERADDAYRDVQASFESDRQTAKNRLAELNTEHDQAIRAWTEGVQQARSRIEEEVESLRSRLQETVDWAEGIKGDIQIAALAAGFQTAEKRYRHRSWWALGVAAVFAVGTIVLTLTLFSTLWEVPAGATNGEIVRHVGFRLGAISLPLFAAIFAARIYRTNSHLEAVNGERAQAATAFEGFAARASGDQARDSMLVVLAQLVFAGRDTGHHTDETIASPINLSDVLKTIR